jgi:hypothetical protein
MGHLKDFQSGTSNDPFTVGSSGSLTLSYGTANGVAYLNGSKVLTTGSALTFDGSKLLVSSFGEQFKLLSSGDFTSTGSGYIRWYDSVGSKGYLGYIGTANTMQLSTGGSGFNLDLQATGSIIFEASAAEQMRLTSTGLGIGTSSPSVKLDVAGNATIQNGVLTIGKDTVYDAFINTPESMYFNVDSDGNSTGNRFVWGTDRTGTSGGTEWMRIDSSGNLLVGKTNSTGINAGAVLVPSGGFTLTRTGTSSSDQVIFYRGTAGSETYVGTITTTGTATSYVTSSDYRLKNTIAPMTGALAKVALLKPCTYKWNSDGSKGEGFIAHELEEVCPQAVTGEKDAVDADGNPKYQGIDTSFLVATLTAAIQELKAEFDAYKASHP